MTTTTDPQDVAPRDLFLSPDLTETDAQRYLKTRGFGDPRAADEHLQLLADDLPTRLALGEIAGPLLEALLEAPDPDAAVVGFCRYVATRAPKSSLISYLHDDPRSLQVLTYILGASPFLTEVLIRTPEYFHWLQHELDGPPPDLTAYKAQLHAILSSHHDTRRQLDALKRFKRREMLRIAGRDFLDKDTLRSSTQQLSNLADVVTEGAMVVLSDKATASPEGALPGAFVVIGMGKLGGQELNYSSDIDLMYVYETATDDDPGAHRRFDKFARALTATLAEHTDEGYFYRVDLRLRPMGKRGNIAYSLSQSRQYYETLGETFERFAMIKARPIAGDMALGDRFVEMIRPFVYRKYLDHAAIEELASYKARSDREKARHDATERNVKVGPGGIREIELFAQVFQLIYGGTHPELQNANTTAALESLQRLDYIDETVTRDLGQAYEFLRRVEHRLQLVQEGQTHTLSGEAGELMVTARRLRFDRTETFLSALEAHRERVHQVYSDLFDRSSDDPEFQGRQLFRLLSGELTDAEGADYLRSLDFPEPDGALQAILALDDVASLAHSKTSTRNLLANLLATALPEVAECGSPRIVLTRFHQVVSRARAPAALYRSLLENDRLRARLVNALDAGDLFAQRLGRYPELLDSLVAAPQTPDRFRHAMGQGFDNLDGQDLDQCMDPFRRLKAIQEFKSLVEWLGGAPLSTLNKKLSMIADAALEFTTTRAWLSPTAPDGSGDSQERWVVLALGKLGGRELTVHSDLDLVFLYDGDPGDSAAYQRQQAFVRTVYEFLQKRTSEGIAYDIDTRLRPEGKKGALAIPTIAFSRYLESRAEIWERMAWTRCRFVTGSQDLGIETMELVHNFIYGPWDTAMPGYARNVRTRMEREIAKEATGERLHLKVGKGGLADIDFLLQLVQIREGTGRSEFRLAGTREMLSSLPDNRYIGAPEADQLREAYDFLRTLETVLRIESDTGRGWIPTAPSALESIAPRVGVVPSTGEALLQRYREVTGGVREIFEAGMSRLEAPGS